MMWGTASAHGVVIGRPIGTIDDSARDTFLSELRNGVAQAAAEGSNFVVDLAGIDHIGVQGLMALTVARKDALAKGVRIALARPKSLVREVLDIGRYNLLFDIVDDPLGARA